MSLNQRWRACFVQLPMWQHRGRSLPSPTACVVLWSVDGCAEKTVTNGWQLELALVPDSRRLVGKHDEAHRLLVDSPMTRRENGRSQSSTQVKWSSERRPRLSRMAAVDIDDSGSQTSSGCPTSSSSTSTTPPTVHQMARPDRTGVPHWPVTAAVGGIPSRVGEPLMPVVAVCRVRPLTDVDWCGGQHLGAGQRPAATSTSPPEAIAPSDGWRRDRPDDGGGSARWELGIIATSPPYDDDCAMSAEGALLFDRHEMVAESKVTVYNNVQQMQMWRWRFLTRRFIGSYRW